MLARTNTVHFMPRWYTRPLVASGVSTCSREARAIRSTALGGAGGAACPSLLLEYRRRLPHFQLPHFQPDDVYIFLTWRLFGLLPAIRITGASPTPAHAFVAADRVLDRPGFGPQWLRDPRIAALAVETIQIGESRSCYELDAWVVMPNHVHLLILPRVPVPAILCWLKSWTARQANQLLGRSAQPFWQDESYDLYWVRNRRQRDRIVRYIEDHPVSAGLVASGEQWAGQAQAGRRHRLPHHRGAPALPLPVRKCRNSRRDF